MRLQVSRTRKNERWTMRCWRRPSGLAGRWWAYPVLDDEAAARVAELAGDDDAGVVVGGVLFRLALGVREGVAWDFGS